jgi:hypothetical protein
LISEFGLFGFGLWVYLRTTRAKDGVGRWALVGLVALLLLAYISTLLSGPPPNATAVGWSALILWLLVPWAAWIDRHRNVVEP